LPQSSIIALTQTRDGYLWLGTLNGLVRFDGVRFTVFDEGNTPELNSSRIVSLFEESSGNLWIGTETAGVALALAESGEMRSVDLGRGSRDGRLVSACEDGSGAVWLYTAEGELCRYRDGRADVWSFGSSQVSNYRAVIPAESGGIWVGMRAGMNSRLVALTPRQDPGQREITIEQEIPVRMLDAILPSRSGGFWRLADGRIQKWKNGELDHDLGPYPWDTFTTSVTAVCEDREGNLLVGTRGAGVFWFDSDGRHTRLSTSEGLSHNFILSLEVDREGSVWIGTDGGGVNRVKRQVFERVKETADSVVQSVAQDREGGLWIGAHSGGVSHWKDGVWRHYLTNTQVRSVLADDQKRVWVGALGLGGGLSRFHQGSFQRVWGPPAVQQSVLSMHQDRNGKLWFGTQNGLVSWDERDWKVYTTREGLSANEVRAIVDDAEGNLWVGTVGGGLNLLRDGEFTVFRKSEEGLPSEDISFLHLDAEGVLWISTFGSGLARFHQGRWTRYTTRDGLISNGIGYLIEDEAGFLWMGSNAGLMRAPKTSLNDFAEGKTSFISSRVYDRPDGLPTRECTQGSQPGAARTEDGRLWFPTIKGLVSVDPSQIKPNPFPPLVLIESILVEGEPQIPHSIRGKPPETIRIPPGKERLEIQFTGWKGMRPPGPMQGIRGWPATAACRRGHTVFKWRLPMRMMFGARRTAAWLS
jgi:streptogramin lyase